MQPTPYKLAQYHDKLLQRNTATYTAAPRFPTRIAPSKLSTLGLTGIVGILVLLVVGPGVGILVSIGRSPSHDKKDASGSRVEKPHRR